MYEVNVCPFLSQVYLIQMQVYKLSLSLSGNHAITMNKMFVYILIQMQISNHLISKHLKGLLSFFLI